MKKNVELWICTIERVAQIHQVSDDILLLAATGKLKNIARRWLDLNISILIESWSAFRQAVIRRFRREVLFHAVYQKTEARRWNFPRESFQDYAMDKLAILRCLKLPDTSIIQLLINEIGSKSLRETAAILRSKPLEEFVEEMHKISIASGDLYKRSPLMPIKIQSDKNIETLPTKDNTMQKDLFCVYCRAKGHIRVECEKFKKKDKLSGQLVPALPSPVAAVIESDPGPEVSSDFEKDQPNTGTSQSTALNNTVACVMDNSKKSLNLRGSTCQVISINNNSCSIIAFLDLGSPISFIRPSTYSKFFDSSSPINPPEKCYSSIDGDIIQIAGYTTSFITLETLPNFNAIIKLHVLKKDRFPADVIIGRDFVRQNKIIVIHDLTDNELNNRVELFQEVAAINSLDDNSKNLSSILSNININFENDIKSKLVNSILEIENLEIPPVDNDYFVKINLKDESTYAYAPRRFAWSERLNKRDYGRPT